MRFTLVLVAALIAPAAHAQPIRTSVQKIYNERHAPSAEPATRVAIRPSTPVVGNREYEVIVPGSCAGRATWNSRYDSTRRALQVTLAAYPVIGTPIEGASPRDDASLAAVYTTCDWPHEAVGIRTLGDYARRVDTTASYVMNGIIVDPGAFEGVGRPPVAVQRAFVAADAEGAKALQLRLQMIAVFTVRAADSGGTTLLVKREPSRVKGDLSERGQDVRLLRVDDLRFEVRDRTTDQVVAVLGKPSALR